MFLRHYTLSTAELSQLDEIMTLINGDEKRTQLHGVFRSELSAFMLSNDLSEKIFGKNPNRFLTSTTIANREYTGVVVIYDFLTSHFVRSHYLTAMLDEDLKAAVKNLRKKILSLKRLRKKTFKNHPNPLVNTLNTMDLDSQTGTANESVFKEYVGYRRSSDNGDIIRFYLKLKKTQLNRTIAFENRYRRGEDNWRVEGFGYVVQDVYYLIGHCQNDDELSRGMRMMALRRHVHNELLYGVLTSMDRRDPICCRIVLIPYDDHHFPERGEMAKEDHIEDILLRNGSDDYKSFTKAVDKSLGPFTRDDPDLLYRYICNANLSVIRADPERDRDLIDLELNFRRAYFEKYNGKMDKIKDKYIQIMSNALESELTN